MRHYLKEPLVQFLMGGLVLYTLLNLSGELKDSAPPNHIEVTGAALVTYLQYRSKTFDAAAATVALSQMDATTRAQLENDFVEEELLYREALALGLDDHDDIVRKRLVQKMLYLLQGFDAETASFPADEVKAYYQAHQDRYTRPARATFSHIFFSNKPNGHKAATDRADALLPILRNGNIAPADAGQYGDRFHLHQHYAARTDALIQEHFGPDAQNAIFGDTPTGAWFGPVASPYGAHLIFISGRTQAVAPPLEEVATSVVADMQREAREQARRQGLERLKRKYSIVKEGMSE